ncbi:MULTISPECIES: ADDT family thymidine hypermodification transferase [Frankia]|nr:MULTISPECIES: hypothetical protein [Frankia]
MTPTPHSEQMFGTYWRWHQLQVTTRDIDPVYPVLRHVIRAAGLDRDQAVWLVVLHVAYYQLGSALAAWGAQPVPGGPRPGLLTLPTGTERRAHRDVRQFARHWAGLLGAFDRHGGPAGWLDAGGADWRRLNEHVAQVEGNGRWAAYKTAELAQKVLDVPTVVADAGHAHSTGPRRGLALLYPRLPAGNRPVDIQVLDRYTRRLARRLGEADIGQVETSLCDLHSLTRGHYYLGHDIDAMQQQLTRVPSDLTAAAFAARAARLPAAYLGERGGWSGVDRERKRVYARQGIICTR